MAPMTPHWLSALPTVGDFMDTRVVTVRPDTEILDAIELLTSNHVTGAPVVDEEGRLLGMLTEKDCLKLVTMGEGADVPQGPVEKFMERELTTISAETDIYYAAGVFSTNHFRRLPVVEDGKLVGALTRLDLLRVVSAYLRGAERDL